MPPKQSNAKTILRAGELRKELTPAEKKLWSYLRGDKLNGVSFRRQHARSAGAGHAIGNYIVDFVSIKKKLVIELDGSQHLEQAEYDAERSRYFESQGYRVIPQGNDVRLWNNQIEKEMDGVIHVIENILPR